MKSVASALVLLSFISACSSKPATTDAVSTAAAASSPKSASAKSSAPGNRVTCTQNTDIRLLDIKDAASGGGCELLYTKYGTEKSVASGSGGQKYCTEVREKISTNLTRSGFKCE